MNRSPKDIEGFAQDVFTHVKVHPIDHDPSEIDHPFWPIVSTFSRDKMPELVETLSKSFNSETWPENKFERDSCFKTALYPLNLMAFLRMKEGEIFPNREFDKGIYFVTLHFSARSGGIHACFFATEAIKNPVPSACFATSSRLQGFYENLDSISKVMEHNDLNPWRKLASDRELDDETIKWSLQSTFKESPPRTREEMDAMCKAWMNAKAAAELRKKRGLVEKTNSLANSLKLDWIPCAHWCRTTKGIIDFYPHFFELTTTKDHDAARGRIDTEISKLGLSKNRHPDNEDQILNASKRMLEHLNSST